MPPGGTGLPPWAAASMTEPVTAWGVWPVPEKAAPWAAQAPGVLWPALRAACPAACWVAGVGFCDQVLAALMALKSAGWAGLETFSALRLAHLTESFSGKPCASDFTASPGIWCCCKSWACCTGVMPGLINCWEAGVKKSSGGGMGLTWGVTHQ